MTAERNGFYISKAAALVEHFGFRALAPETAAAFERFLADATPAKSDPQCWAKTALVSALHSLDYRPATALYLRGLRHIQLEPVFGSRADSAGALRAKCALALADSELPPHSILIALTDLLIDPDHAARLAAVRAIARTAQPESALLIRLKALTGDGEHPDVMRECLLSLMTLAPADSTEFVARYLENKGNELLCADAAEALASSHHPEALAALLRFLKGPSLPIDIRRTTLLTLAASPLREAGEYLASVIGQSECEVEIAEAATAALGASRFREEHRVRIEAIVEARKSRPLAAAFQKAFVMGEGDI